MSWLLHLKDILPLVDIKKLEERGKPLPRSLVDFVRQRATRSSEVRAWR